MGDKKNIDIILGDEKKLEQKELDKIKRLNFPISMKFHHAGLFGVRLCQGSGTGQERLLIFGDANHFEVGSVRADDFLAASDGEAVEMIKTIAEYRYQLLVEEKPLGSLVESLEKAQTLAKPYIEQKSKLKIEFYQGGGAPMTTWRYDYDIEAWVRE